MTSSSKTSFEPANLPWFETLSSRLTHSHPFCKHSDQYVPEAMFPKSIDRPHLPPPGCTCFFLVQLEGDLRLPVPTAYLHILLFYQIPLNQLAPNVFRILARTVMVFKHLQLSLSPVMFHCLFQMKMAELGVFYFIGHPDYQFLRGMPFSHKGWKSFYFFARLPTPCLTLRSDILNFLNSSILMSVNSAALSLLLCIPSEITIMIFASFWWSPLCPLSSITLHSWRFDLDR